jgi:hypothetical protein
MFSQKLLVDWELHFLVSKKTVSECRCPDDISESFGLRVPNQLMNLNNLAQEVINVN